MIYLDHNATTPLDPFVFQEMEPYLKDLFGNSSSSYLIGREAKAALENARKTIAEGIGAKSHEVIFTSGGTEANNLAIRGVARALKSKGNHIITSSVEHKSVLKTCQMLEKEGFRVTYLPVDADGIVDPDDVRKNIEKQTILISIMLANNETGVIQPVREIGIIASQEDVLFHTDAVQAVGKIPVLVDDLLVDILSVSGHKLYGPKGIGALYIREGTQIEPIITGGDQESKLRAGTENIPSIVGLSKALSLAIGEMDVTSKNISIMRDKFESNILKRITDVQINGISAPRLPNTSSVSLKYVEGESVLLHLDLMGIYASSGSACTTGSPEPSHVLMAMRVPQFIAQGTIRISLGKNNTEKEIDTTLEALCEITEKLRKISSIR